VPAQTRHETFNLDQTMTSRSFTADSRGAAVSILVHVLALLAGFSLLGAIFEFPEILRQTSPYRLTLFLRNQASVQATYWLLAMTGFTQIAMAVFLHQCFRERDTTLQRFALVFGILTGVLQTMGFIRWVIVIPYLAQQMADPAASATTRETVALIEGAFNRYAGMALGEHTANICLGLWTGLVGMVMARSQLVDARLAWGGVFIAPLAWLLAAEQVGLSGWLLEAVTLFGFPLWAVWLILVALSLLRTDAATLIPPRMTWRTVLLGGVLYCLLLLPALFE